MSRKVLARGVKRHHDYKALHTGSKRRRMETVEVEENFALSAEINDAGAGGSIREAVPENEQVVFNNNDNEEVQVQVSTGDDGVINNGAILDRTGNDLLTAEKLEELSNSKHNNNLPLCIGRPDGQQENILSNLTPGAPPQPIPIRSMKHHTRRDNSFKFLRTKYNLLQSEIEKQLLLNGHLDNHCTVKYVDKIDKLLAKVNVKNVDSLLELIEEKQSVFANISGYRIKFPNSNESEPSLLHDVIMEGNIQQVTVLVAQGVNVHARDSKGLTPLHLCILSGSDKYLDMIKILVAHGADINSTCNLDKPLLLLAAEKGKCKEDLQEFVKLGANFTTADGAGDTILHYLSRQGDVESLKFFIHIGASVNAVNKFKNKPLHAAAIYCKQNFIETVDILVMYDDDVHARGANDRSAYWFAVRVKKSHENIYLWNLVEKPRSRGYLGVATP